MLVSVIRYKELALIKQVNQKNKNFYYWYFKYIGYRYKPHLCKDCHGLMQKAVSFSNFIYIKGSVDRIRFWYMSKHDAINIMNSSNLIGKMRVL